MQASAIVKAILADRPSTALKPLRSHLTFKRRCEGSSLAENCLLGAYMRLPPCSSPPFAGAQVGLCAVVMTAEGRQRS